VLLDYLKTVLVIASPVLVLLATLYMMARWYTAIVELVAIGIFVYYAARRYNKYHRAEKYNDQNWERSRW
jgi:hypothetical protein